MSVKSTTSDMGLIKYSLGHPVRDTDLATNMDLIDTAIGDGVKVLKGSLTSGASGAFAFYVQNPESVECHMLQTVVDVTTVGGTASSVMDVGLATSASGTGDTILDGIDINADAAYSSLSAGVSGTNATENVHRWNAAGGSNDYITGKILVADATNMVGTYTLLYTKAA